MKLEIKDITNKHKNIPAIVLGHGPSLDNYKEKLLNFKKEGYILFGCNDWYYYYSTVPNYWVLATNAITVQNHVSKMNEYKNTIIYSYVSDPTDPKFVEHNLFCDFVPYHQYPASCVYGTAGKGLSIQEHLKAYTNYTDRYGIGACVGLHVVSFSILMGCNPIYLVGIDVDYNLGFSKNTNPETEKGIIQIEKDGAFSKEYKENVLSDLKIINDSAKNIGVSISNLNQNSIHSIFKIKNI